MLIPCSFNCAGTLIILVTILVGRFRSSGRSAIFTVKRSEKFSRLRLATEYTQSFENRSMMLSIRGFTRDDRNQKQNQSRNMTKTRPLSRFLFRKHADDVTVQCSSMENCRCTELEGGHYGGHCVPLLHDTDLQHSQVCFLKRHHPQVLACVYMPVPVCIWRLLS